MKLIDREMIVKESITEKSNTFLYCQASLNSDGNITLRNYNIKDKNSDQEGLCQQLHRQERRLGARLSH